MKKIGAIAVAGLLFISSTQAQEVGDVVNDPNTFLKMLSTVKDYSLTQPTINSPAANSELKKHTGQFFGTCEKNSFVLLSGTLIYTLNEKLERISLPGYALFDKNGNGTWSAPGWDLLIPAGAKDASLGAVLASYTLIPKGGILMNRTMPNRSQYFKIKLPLVFPKAVKGDIKKKVRTVH